MLNRYVETDEKNQQNKNVPLLSNIILLQLLYMALDACFKIEILISIKSDTTLHVVNVPIDLFLFCISLERTDNLGTENQEMCSTMFILM